MGHNDRRSTRTVAIEGAELHVEQTGDPTRRPVLLLHGGLGSTEDFAELVPLLPESYRLISLDARGHGRSTMGTAPLSYARLETDVVAVLDTLEIDQVDVVGFSDGGIVGYRLAAHHPERVGALITIGADWELPADSPTRAILASVTPDSWRARFPDTEADYLARNPEPDFDRLVRACVEMWIDADGYPGDDTARIVAPLTIVRGGDDHLATQEMALALIDRVPHAELREIDGAGHAVAATHPDAIAEIVMGVLGSSASSG